MRSWYVLKTKPRLEDQTSLVLQSRNLEVYLPKIALWMGRAPDGKLRKQEPLFPGYMFARLDLKTTDWLLARSAPGVAYFLGFDGLPSPLPDDLVESVRLRAEEQQRRGWRPSFRSGDRVVIVSGPMAGLEAIFEGALSPSGRSRVFVQMVSRLVPVTVPAAILRRAG